MACQLRRLATRDDTQRVSWSGQSDEAARATVASGEVPARDSMVISTVEIP